MRHVRVLAPLGLAAVLAANGATARGTADAPGAAEETETRPWAFSAYAFAYIVPDDEDFVLPTFSADRGWLHLEARYNYEDRDTASAWLGYNLSFGEKVTFDLTPMAGGVYGDTTGIAPGYKATLGWRKLELYSEAEYVFDTDGSAESFFYTWSEASYAPWDWFRFGLVVQRTKVYKTDFDVQRGALIGFSCKHVDFTAYVLNPDASRPVVVLSLGGSF